MVQPPCPVGTDRMAPWGGPAGPGAAPAYRGPTTFWWVPLSPWPASAATRFLASGAHKIHSAADFSGVFKTKTTSMPLACISCTHRCSIRARYCSASSDGANQRNTLCGWIPTGSPKMRFTWRPPLPRARMRKGRCDKMAIPDTHSRRRYKRDTDASL